jgi:hypothetical protein
VSDRRLEQGGSDPAPPEGGLDENHPDPGEVVAVGGGRGGAGGAAVVHGEEAPAGRQEKKALPVPSGLVPAGGPAQAMGEGQVGFAEGAQHGGHDRAKFLPDRRTVEGRVSAVFDPDIARSREISAR